MEFIIPQAAPNTSPYVSAPTSPGGCSQSSIPFYSAPTSPMKTTTGQSGDAAAAASMFDSQSATLKTNDHIGNSTLDDFEFETSKKFSCFYMEEAETTSPNFEYLEQLLPPPPPMAFADELFSDGKVTPLKLPPRLNYAGDQGSSSIASSPKSPGSAFKIPFHRRFIWNDDYDPFAAALKKVKEEKGGNGTNHHRRTRSDSPFRTRTTPPAAPADGCNNQINHNKSGPISTQGLPLAWKPVECKGSAYARWVISQTKQEGKGSNESKRVKMGLPQKAKVPVVLQADDHERVREQNSVGNAAAGSRVQRIKGLLLRYASFGKENDEGGGKGSQTSAAASSKAGYFKRLSFKFKGNPKKKQSDDSKLAVVRYNNKPTLTLCMPRLNN